MILSIIEQELIWYKILGHSNKKRFGNPFYYDKNQDCCLRKVGNNLLLYDFGDRDYFGMHVTEAYFKKFGENYVSQDLGTIKLSLVGKTPLVPSVIPWSKRGLKYWSNYGIDITKYDWISEVDGFYLDSFNPVSLGFVYFYETLPKIYLPFSKPKFLGNVPQNYTKILGTGEKVIACKSVKDQLIIDRLLDVTTYHVQSENSLSPPTVNPDYVFFDSDDAGIIGAETYSKNFGGKVVCTEKAKDISDYYFYYGEERTRDLLQSLFDIKP